MSRKYDPAAIGAFVLGAVLLAIFSVVFFGGGKLFRSTTPHVSYFPGSIKGLEVGAPVTFRGVRVGSVTDIQAIYDINDHSIYLPVIFELERDRLQTVGDRADLGVDPDDDVAVMEHLIGLGMRARLELRSLVTGQLNIELDMFPDSPVNLAKLPGPYQEIPTLPTSIEQFRERLENFLNRIEGLPIADMVKNLGEAIAGIQSLVSSDRTQSIFQGVDRLVNSPELRSSLANLDRALVSFDAAMRSTRAFVEDADGKLEPAYDKFIGAAEGLEAALTDARDLIDSVRDSVSEDSELRARSGRAMEELEAAAEAVRVLADYLGRHPESLFRGKPQPGDDR
jgi:paraquat-inducible protein B